MIKEDIIGAVSKRVGCNWSLTSRIIDEMMSVVLEAIERGEKVQFLGFGTFDTQKRAARTGRNLNTDEPLPIPAKTVAVFKPGSRMKAAAERSEQ